MVDRRRVLHSLLIGAASAVGAAGFGARAAVKREVVTDKSFGVKGDGKTNDRIALQNAIDRSVDQTLLITGQCRIDAKGLDLRRDSHVRFAPGASIKLLPHDTSFYSMFRIWDVSNVLVENAVLDGSKELNAAKPALRENGHGMGFSIAGSTEVTLISPKTVGCWGDGIYIANSYEVPFKYSSNIRVVNHHANRCRRQGLSIISGRNIVFESPLWENIGGTQPEAGMDAEPNSNADILENIRIVNPVTRNCRYGIIVWLEEIVGPVPKHVDIGITNHRDESATDAAFAVSSLKLNGRKVSGQIVSHSPTWVGARMSTVESIDYDRAGPKIVVTNLRLVP
ncbi:hypothetical protein BSFA1_47620 [Burkholderia sp. SFA1]|uniref:glycoside hydrolase family 55 protein n=1 Tax=Caballeronia sp. CLC5 TaxID=2906764 RepID=UPI001F171B73|nr:glycoside hydrolase family 55 protein [Caballeronia sp. CLC5]MCE4574250.1 glycoside hydrolase family 55 protein [Caballeronia sp. CLC5]BBP99633.1 hypothetical protein BSFA1_47620 [Burkholderia sp. SFA1]